MNTEMHWVLTIIMTLIIISSSVIESIDKLDKKECITDCDRPPIVLLPVFIKIFRYPKSNLSDHKDETIALHQVIYGVLFIILCEIILGVRTSIAGVTYMDDFDFEERYEDVNECNPFYWHPLHLPEECFQIFDTLIRSRLAFSPYRIFKEKKQMQLVYPYTYINPPLVMTEIFEEVRPPKPSSPLEVLFKLLKRDIINNPSGPSIENSPYFGTVATYKQPVSYKSVNMIKNLARLYANAYPMIQQNTQQNMEYEKAKKKSEINQKKNN